MNMISTDTPAAVTPTKAQSRHSASAATFGTASASLPSAPMSNVDAWLRMAARHCRTPLSRSAVMVQIEQRLPELVATRAEEARLLGEVLGTAEDAGLRALFAVLASAPRPPWLWLESLFAGVAQQWPRGLARAVTVSDPDTQYTKLLLQFVARHLDGSIDVRDALVYARNALAHGQPARSALLHAVAHQASRGNLDALHALELDALRNDVDPAEKARSVARYQKHALLAMSGLLATRADVQPIVDIAVAIVDVSLKSKAESALDELLAQFDPSEWPSEVAVALLTTTRQADSRLPARSILMAEFARVLHARKSNDADAVLQFLR